MTGGQLLPRPRRLAVVGGGWAGLSAAVHAVAAGCQVTVFEMARQWGGRARSQPEAKSDQAFDNGQHILIGAYSETLALMRRLGVEPDTVLMRKPLFLQRSDGSGLHLRAGPAAPAFAAAVLRCTAWTWPEKLRLLLACTHWAAGGFTCDPDRSVDALCQSLPPRVRNLLIDPLCVAALNTPAPQASASAFLRVLRDGLFGGRGASDLLLPRTSLQQLLPGPATQWLGRHGAQLLAGQRVTELQAQHQAWSVNGRAFDAVVLACPALEAARLVEPHHTGWAACARGLRFEPIVTVYVRCAGANLPMPMMALSEDDRSPAQFVFDHGAISGHPGTYAFVISGAAPWVERGLTATADAVLAQARQSFPATAWPASQAQVEHIVAERRATFRCSPGLVRPVMQVAAGLVAAGDYVAGPYPSTLEGAVRSGRAAAAALQAELSRTHFHHAK